ncbi:hypothetical protein CMUS01_13940 [Colletotrichum musicola]|uniref:Uncharacterized protein n=1 Tax=Colletotrichum musicola TaxID=2175873 RepID=A0A8H6MU01_9PEZI|nr:hypothetical protein CMUS01_13940 [Colletotrichum musicola]
MVMIRRFMLILLRGLGMTSSWENYRWSVTV